MDYKLQIPAVSDCAALTELVFKSKASHGYSDRFMEACRDELEVTSHTLSKGPAILAIDVRAGHYLGFAQVVKISSKICELEALFIAPKSQGLGIGRALFEWAAKAAISLDVQKMHINSDPGAEEFYRNLGAKRTGSTPSGSIPGRILPQLTFVLK